MILIVRRLSVSFTEQSVWMAAELIMTGMSGEAEKGGIVAMRDE
jgi:hypothetical protein